MLLTVKTLNPRHLLALTMNECMEEIQEWRQNLDFSWKDVFSYFSTWAICASMIPFQTKLFQLVRFNMILQAAIGGFYITYIHPKEIKIHYLNLIVDGFLLKMIDLVAHQSLLFIYLYFGTGITSANGPNSGPCGSNSGPCGPTCFFEYLIMNLPFSIYLMNFDLEEKYGVKQMDLMKMVPFYYLFIFFIFSFFI